MTKCDFLVFGAKNCENLGDYFFWCYVVGMLCHRCVGGVLR